MISVDFNAFSRSSTLLHFSLFVNRCTARAVGRVDEESTNFMHASVE